MEADSRQYFVDQQLSYFSTFEFNGYERLMKNGKLDDYFHSGCQNVSAATDNILFQDKS